MYFLSGRCSARVVPHEGLGGWFLIHDEEAIGAANDVLERDVLVARDDGETIVLGAHLFVFLQRHRYALFASDVPLAIRLPALAVKLERHVLISESGCLVQSFDLLVDLAHERLVSRLPLTTSLHVEVLRLQRAAHKPPKRPSVTLTPPTSSAAPLGPSAAKERR